MRSHADVASRHMSALRPQYGQFTVDPRRSLMELVATATSTVQNQALPPRHTHMWRMPLQPDPVSCPFTKGHHDFPVAVLLLCI